MNKFIDISEFKRIALVGSLGSGKSWLAIKIADVLKLPLIHLDKEYWKKGWVPKEKEQWRKSQQKIVEQDCWIIDGNYNSTLDVRLEKADVVIFLDIKRIIWTMRVIKRRRKKRIDMPKDLIEPPLFSKYFISFIKYVWKFSKNQKIELVNKIESYPHLSIVHLKSKKQIYQFLKNFNVINN